MPTRLATRTLLPALRTGTVASGAARAIAGRSPAAIKALELRGIYPEHHTLVAMVPTILDHRSASISASFPPDLPTRRATWQLGRGCTLAPVGAMASTTLTTGAAVPSPIGGSSRP